MENVNVLITLKDELRWLRRLYNDSPWIPGIGDQSNECKRCEFNDHATR